MKKTRFPLTYFSALTTPKKMFAGRKNLNWWQIIFVWFFLSALLGIGVTCFYTFKMEQMPLSVIFKEEVSFLTDKATEQVTKLNIAEGKLLETESQVFQEDKTGVLGVALDLSANHSQKNFISFEKESWQIGVNDGEKLITYTLPYTSDFQNLDFKNHEELQTFVERQFYQSNRPTIILSYSWSLGIILLLMSGGIFFGSGFFLWLTRKNKFSQIKTYRQSVNLVLNVFGPATFLALMFSLFYFDFTWLIGIQTFGGVLTLLAVYSQTKFKDVKEKTNDAYATI